MKQSTSKLSLDKKTIIQMGALQQNQVNGGNKDVAISTFQSALNCDTITCCSYSFCSAFICDTQE
jgi:hypothetical protein